ncbi:MAG: sigma-70 family RNA polymerase sigma factor [Oscillospiraceae bacterium]|nr:sigma-70 family RNA polymerase sigma factor [Oscillospiraceae bacterium]
MEDAQIIERFFRRDEAALHETDRKYHGYCRKIAMQILQSPEDADEAVNDTWLAAWNSIPPHRPERLQTFLGRLTRNISLKKLRSSQAVKRGAGNAEAVLDEVADWLRAEHDTESEADARMLADAINRFLDKLPETDRQVFVRRYWYFQSVAEIAEALSCSESKVKSMLYRTRNKLHTALEKEALL